MLKPDPMLWKPVVLPSEVFVPHSNHAVAKLPFGFTLPFKAAEFWLMPDAEFVVTEGRPPEEEGEVMNERTLPTTVP